MVHLHARSLRKRTFDSPRTAAWSPGDPHVEGVLHAARGMVFGALERLEVVVVGLNLRDREPQVAHAEEDVRDFVDDAANQMTCAPICCTRPGQRDVDRLGVHLRQKLGRCKALPLRASTPTPQRYALRLRFCPPWRGLRAQSAGPCRANMRSACLSCPARSTRTLELRRVGSLRDAVRAWRISDR